MYKIIDKRATGKTNKLMLLAKEHNAIVVCSNPYTMMGKAYAYGITGMEFISYGDYTTKNYPLNRPVLIDDIELYIESLGDNLIGYTLSVE